MVIEESFKNTAGATVEAAMSRYDFPFSVRNWIVHMLATQLVTAAKVETTVETRVKSGCPQGGVLLPLLRIF